MELHSRLRNFFSPTKMLDTGHIDKFNALPSGGANNGFNANTSLTQYVANRFTRGNIRGQIFALLTHEATAERYKKVAKIKWC